MNRDVSSLKVLAECVRTVTVEENEKEHTAVNALPPQASMFNVGYHRWDVDCTVGTVQWTGIERKWMSRESIEGLDSKSPSRLVSWNHSTPTTTYVAGMQVRIGMVITTSSSYQSFLKLVNVSFEVRFKPGSSGRPSTRTITESLPSDTPVSTFCEIVRTKAG